MDRTFYFLFPLLVLLFCKVISNDIATIAAMCQNAPNPALQVVCAQLQAWDTTVRQRSTQSAALNVAWSSWDRTSIWSDNRTRTTTLTSHWSVWSSWTTSWIIPIGQL
ncbi:hypothetical protein AB6A40_004662 [Gnathostoma spinigerum]|uniref:Secreted protein n=1 Tax=Gnathostoma spinigerum TaxID=75299 RepID=A0ABD6ELW1_9BILA